MSDIVSDFEGESEVKELDKIQREMKFKIVAKTKELRSFNGSMAEKSKEMASKFQSHAKILEKIQEDLQYIHQTIKMVEHFDNSAARTESDVPQPKPAT